MSFLGGGVSPMRGILSFDRLGSRVAGVLRLPWHAEHLPTPVPRPISRPGHRLFEPYPENELGRRLSAARPREYQDPQAEVTRALQRPAGEPILAPYPQQCSHRRRSSRRSVTAAASDLLPAGEQP